MAYNPALQAVIRQPPTPQGGVSGMQGGPIVHINPPPQGGYPGIYWTPSCLDASTLVNNGTFDLTAGNNGTLDLTAVNNSTLDLTTVHNGVLDLTKLSRPSNRCHLY